MYECLLGACGWWKYHSSCTTFPRYPEVEVRTRARTWSIGKDSAQISRYFCYAFGMSKLYLGI